MSTIINLLLTERNEQDYHAEVEDKPRLIQNMDLIISAVGKNNISSVRSLDDENINRLAIYGTAYDDHSLYLEIFQRLNPSFIWLQDDTGKTGSRAINEKISENGGCPQVGLYLMWSQAPGKIYCAYRHNRNDRFYVERFMPHSEKRKSFSGITTIETPNQVQNLVNNQLNNEHYFEWWNDPTDMMEEPYKNPNFKELAKLLNRNDELENEIDKLQSDLYKIPSGKKERKYRLELAKEISDYKIILQKNNEAYNEKLLNLGYSITNPDPSGLHQWQEFNKCVDKIEEVKEILNSSRQDEQLQSKCKADLNFLKSRYTKAFDALI